MAVNAECLHFAQVINLSSPVHLSNLVSLDAQVQKRRVTTDFILTPLPFCMGIVNEDEDIVIKRVKLEDDRKDTMRY